MAMPVWLPAGAAGINDIAFPILLTPLLWALPFFYACLEENLVRGTLVISGAIIVQGALVAVAMAALMRALSQTQIKRLTAIHGWSAVVLGLLLYAVVATGAVAVFANEIGRWSVGAPREAPPLDGPIDARVRQLAGEVDPDVPARRRHLVGRGLATCTSSSTPTR